MPPTVFISYSHDSDDHKVWVRRLAEDLRRKGVEVTLDQWDAPPGTDLVRFMEVGVSSADFVVVICSDSYIDKADERRGGAGYESMVLYAELLEKLDTKKFIPVIRGSTTTPPRLPKSLGGRRYVDFRSDESYTERVTELAAAIHEVPLFEKPPLGENPFTGSSAPPMQEPDVKIERMDVTPHEFWFASESEVAKGRLYAAGLIASATMEIKMAVSPAVGRTRAAKLLEAARASQISTFGWPIGVVLENREDAKPKPTAEGIRAEVVSVFKSGFDFWALRSTGEFYLLQTLFEEERDPEAIFFNTRIVRTAETLMYGSRLYSRLGAPEGSLVQISLGHNGFAERTLKVAGGNRHLFPRKTSVGDISSTTEFRLPLDEDQLVRHTKTLISPMFELFDFMEFDDKIYDDIVRRFANGEVT